MSHRQILTSARLAAAVLCAALALPAFTACGDRTEYADLVPRARDLALQFGKSLAHRNYNAAYRLTSRELRSEMSAEEMQEGFERVIPPDWGETEPVELSKVMHDWTGRRLGDVMWAYVTIYGDVYSEAITFVVTYEDEQLRIRNLEFGRP